ncbi:MAG: DHH family phosphoesterase, partial [bacterium]|nr:DHH family phosphoesterase [bacterium]
MQKYKLAPAPTKDAESALLAYPPLLRQLLFGRGIAEKETAEAFLNPNYDTHTHSPFAMKDMEKAVARILKAIAENERIAIFSDYDADGIPGAVVLHDFFRKIGFLNFENYIPDRHSEGFGLNNSAIQQLSNSGTRLLITIDCGISDVEEVAFANSLGLQVIITDHHIPLNKGGRVGGLYNPPAEDGSAPFTKGDLPPAYAILNPKQADCTYPEKMLCGSGVVFKLIQALVSRLSDSSLKVNGQQ